MSSGQRQRFLENIDAAAARTDRLVTRLLQLARLEAGQQPHRELVALDRWLDALPTRYGADVKLRRKGALERQVDVSALESVVTNLVDNALRYRRQHAVELEIECGRDELYLCVRDDGPGIPNDNQKRLFERFFTTERDRGGTGLGLAIVQAVAQSHGGRVQVNSSEKGTQVEVWMSCSKLGSSDS